jgi:hypothetical protein
LDTADADLVEELAVALASEFVLEAVGADSGSTFVVRERSTSQTWELPYTAERLAAMCRDRQASGLAAGVGYVPPESGPSPGAALLAIHVSEAIATALPGASSLVIDGGGAVAREPE